MEIIKALIPVSRKTFEEANTYYAELIDGLLLADAQHTQIENALMHKIESTQSKKQKNTNNKTDEAYQ